MDPNEARKDTDGFPEFADAFYVPKNRRESFIIGAVNLLGGGWRGTGAIVTACLVVALAFASVLMPFEPFGPLKAEIVPNEVCMSGPVELQLTRTWEQPSPFLGIGDVNVVSTWIDVDTGQRYPALETTVPADTLPAEGTIISDLVRTAPGATGRYVLETVYTVPGRNLIVPTSQTVSIVSTGGPVVVRSCG